MTATISNLFGSYFFLGLAVIIALLIGWIYDRKLKHQEKMLMLEKGINIEKHPVSHHWTEKIWLRLGIVFVLGAVGSAIPVTITFLTNNMFLAVFTSPSLILFAGIGFIIAQNVVKKTID